MASQDALRDCGALDLEPLKQRTAVIIGRGTYVNRGNAAAIQQGVAVQTIPRVAQEPAELGFDTSAWASLH